MGSSGDTKTKGLDEYPGGLVWVRRRNGSWWPGRVLGQDELPESCLTTPRSGTPVKLLGREDASVDWYNLEKSIRIKAFRCGEYDDCIEKAKASASGSTRKAVKYARREDAILQALEIESARQSKNEADICSTVDKPSCEKDNMKECLATIVPNKKTNYIAEELTGSKRKSMLGYELSHSSVSSEDVNPKEQSSQGTRRKTPNDSEDDGIEGIKRMRGLVDLGIGVDLSTKRKRTLTANVHEFLKKKNRRRQLTKVLESTTMVTVPVTREPTAGPIESSVLGVTESKVSGLESNDSKGSSSIVINNNSDSTGENGTSFNACEHANNALLVDSNREEYGICTRPAEDDFSSKLFDVPLIGEDPAGFTSGYVPFAPQKPRVAGGAQSSQSSQVENVPSTNEELNESVSTSSGATNTDASEVKEGSSKWMSKGKRNMRNTCKSRKHGFDKLIDDEKPNEDLNVQEPGGVGTSRVSYNCVFQLKPELVTETQGDEVQGRGTHILDKEYEMILPVASPRRSLPHRQSRYTMNPKYQSSEFSPRVYDPDSNLYDVNLEVNSKYRPQHVPYISLMSKLTGKPVIGHPLIVEALDGDICDLLQISSACHGDENGSQGLDMVSEKRPNRRGGKIPRKKHHLSHQHDSTSKSSKSRRIGLISKKIRKLSSITCAHKHRVQEKQRLTQKVKGPSISCIPLKVVFSRINAALK